MPFNGRWRRVHDFPIDLWAVGLVFYQLFRSPQEEWEPLDQALSWFHEKDGKKTLAKIAHLQEGWLPFTHENSVRGLICALLHPDPKKRIDSVVALQRLLSIREREGVLDG